MIDYNKEIIVHTYVAKPCSPIARKFGIVAALSQMYVTNDCLYVQTQKCSQYTLKKKIKKKTHSETLHWRHINAYLNTIIHCLCFKNNFIKTVRKKFVSRQFQERLNLYPGIIKTDKLLGHIWMQNHFNSQWIFI